MPKLVWGMLARTVIPLWLRRFSLILGVAVFFLALIPAVANAQPGVPHTLENRSNCLQCHGPGGMKPVPADHAGRGNDTCLSCHRPALGPSPTVVSATPTPVPTVVPAMPTPTPAITPMAPIRTPGEPTPLPSPTITPSVPAPTAPVPSPTTVMPPSPTPTPAKVGVVSAGCRRCHTKPEFTHVALSTAPPPASVEEAQAQRVYAHRFIECTSCHSEDPHKQMAPVTKVSIAEACGRCHTFELALHRGSVHGQSLAAGGRDAASCVDCHSTENTPHSIARIMSPDSPAYRPSIAHTCAQCHAKTELMARYGVPTTVYSSYMATFHGKANVLSPYEITQHPKATCIDCHGYHDIKSVEAPDSPVNKQNLASTCGRCHPGAGERFASGWLGHKEASPKEFPAVYFTERFFFFFTAAVLIL
ncbi:MAG: hypothetical protein M1577_05230 [Chloroflexi bacterium]|nr:hypothetical protein [Chloroflexota bacterium]